MDVKTQHFCDIITPIYSMDVYREWRQTLPQDEFVSNCVEWYTTNHEELLEIFHGVFVTLRDKGMSMKSFIEFYTDAYTVLAYHTEYNAAVARELAELTKSFPYSKS